MAFRGRAGIISAMTRLVTDPAYLQHLAGPMHPESPGRLRAIHQVLEAAPIAGVERAQPRHATREELLRVHAPGHVDRVLSLAGKEAQLDPDTAMSPGSTEAALLAAGAASQLVLDVLRGEVENGFALVRPPGHHAVAGHAMGFCLFNNVTVAAEAARAAGAQRVLVLDWDVHHGNGTQHCFEEDPSVLYISLHQYPYYPGTGSASEIGSGRGRGATLNCPMPAGATDTAYEIAFSDQVLPRLAHFKPDAVLISAGFDAHRDDPLADIQLSTNCYGWMTARVLEIADQYAGGRIVSLLEGGYNLARTADCIERHIAVLNGKLRA